MQFKDTHTCKYVQYTVYMYVRMYISTYVRMYKCTSVCNQPDVLSSTHVSHKVSTIIDE